MNTVERFEYLVSLGIKLILLLAIAGALWRTELIVFIVSSLTLILVIGLPYAIERGYAVKLPLEFELAIVFFIFATLFLGEVHGYYTRFWWWDLVLHAGSAFAFGLVGFLLLFALYASGKLQARPITIAIFSFAFAMAIGAIWEIFEFTMDRLLGLNMQKSGLVDTMSDLIVDGLSALVTSVAGFTYLKYGRAKFFDKLIHSFVNDNPDLFKPE